MAGFLNLNEVLEKYIDGCEKKINSSFFSNFTKSVLAGIFIALGAAVSNVAAHSVSNVGLSRLISGVVFPVGLMLVILLGGELFTGDCLTVLGVFDRKQKISKTLKLLFVVFIGNFVGGILTAFLMSKTGQFDYSSGLLGAYTVKVAVGKVSISFLSAFVSGIFCNVLVCAAVLAAMASKDVSGKLLSCFFIIMLFVTGGFEHCVANMYYIPAGIAALHNTEYLSLATQVYSLTPELLASLNWKNFIFSNLLPVTLGNIVGGSLFVAAPLYYANKEK